MRSIMRIVKVKENKDGSANVTFEFGEDTRKILRKHYKRKRVTHKLFKKVILDAMENYIKKHPIKDKPCKKKT